MTQSFESPVDGLTEDMQINNHYTITLEGGPEHGAFEIVPPLTDQHFNSILKEPKLAGLEYSLNRGEDNDSFWLGSDFNNGSGYGVYYERAAYRARVIADVLRLNGAEVELIYDQRFDDESEQRIQRISEARRRSPMGFY